MFDVGACSTDGHVGEPTVPMQIEEASRGEAMEAMEVEVVEPTVLPCSLPDS